MLSTRSLRSREVAFSDLEKVVRACMDCEKLCTKLACFAPVKDELANCVKWNPTLEESTKVYVESL